MDRDGPARVKRELGNLYPTVKAVPRASLPVTKSGWDLQVEFMWPQGGYCNQYRPSFQEAGDRPTNEHR